MAPKSDPALPLVEVETAPEAEAPKRPATLGRLAIARVTPEELAARRKADEEEEARRREARRPKSGPTGAVAVAEAPPPPLPTAPAPGGEPAPSAPTQPNMLPVSGAGAESLAAQGPVLAQLLESAVVLLGAEGKQIGPLCKLARRLAEELGAMPAGLELVPCAVQALYVASQLDRRGPYTPPELATLQKLLGPTWAELGPLVEPCAKGALSKAKFERPEAAAVAAAVCFFNHTRNVAPPAQTTKAALTTLRGQKWIPADALDALAAAVAG